MKSATTLRAQQAVARYGKGAWRPLCLAALDFWRLDVEVSKWTKDLVSVDELVNSVKQMKDDVQERIEQFRKGRNEKEANQVSALLRKVDELLLKARTRCQLVVQARSIYQELRQEPAARFERERDCVIRTGDAKARRALQRLRKRWSAANEADLKDGNARKLETLNLLRKKVIEQKRKIYGVSDGYLEAARGGERPLSDEEWQGRLTARQTHSHIAATCGDRVAGDKDAKEIRRLARKLPLRLALDERGRKWKWPPPPKEPKQPLGRPRTRPDIICVSDLEAIEASKAAAARGKIQRARIAAR